MAGQVDFSRKSGVLLHPTSLPGKYGIGTLGKEAYNFVDFLIETGQKIWQTCPLGPTGYGDSPYQCFSAFAGNPYLIDIDLLVEDGLLQESDIKPENNFPDDIVDFGPVIEWKIPVLYKAFGAFQKNISTTEAAKLKRFKTESSYWLDDYALFMTLKEEANGLPWSEWDDELKLRDPETVKFYKDKLQNKIEFIEFLQYTFFKQWNNLKAYANNNFISIIGDIPLYVSYDSSDAWSKSEYFMFDERKNPINVAGVPPDYFSATGQLWGNPLYNWDKLEETHFEWWIERVKANLKMSDFIRFDHFRGLAAYWSVPFGESTAINGKWVKCPGEKLFDKIEEVLGKLPIIAEDLGVITQDVVELRERFGFPGMKILQFAFDSEEDSAANFLPHVYPHNSVVYTGTHDNDTVLGWYNNAKPIDREFSKDYLNIHDKNISFHFVRNAWASTANFAIAPLQDILGLGSETRFNTPGTPSGNWQWRFKDGDLTDHIKSGLKFITDTYKR